MLIFTAVVLILHWVIPVSKVGFSPPYDFLWQLIHCIVWAKELALAKLFGDKSQVNELDVRPSVLADAKADTKEVGNDADFFELRRGESTWQFAGRVFDRIFGYNIETALQNEDTWKARRRPDPLYLDKILPPEEFTAEENGNGEIENPTVSAMVTLGLKNPQKIWDVQENARVFLETIQLFFKRRSKVTGLVPCFESAGSLQLQFCLSLWWTCTSCSDLKWTFGVTGHWEAGV